MTRLFSVIEGKSEDLLIIRQEIDEDLSEMEKKQWKLTQRSRNQNKGVWCIFTRHLEKLVAITTDISSGNLFSVEPEYEGIEIVDSMLNKKYVTRDLSKYVQRMILIQLSNELMNYVKANINNMDIYSLSSKYNVWSNMNLLTKSTKDILAYLYLNVKYEGFKTNLVAVGIGDKLLEYRVTDLIGESPDFSKFAGNIIEFDKSKRNTSGTAFLDYFIPNLKTICLAVEQKNLGLWPETVKVLAKIIEIMQTGLNISIEFDTGAVLSVSPDAFQQVLVLYKGELSINKSILISQKLPINLGLKNIAKIRYNNGECFNLNNNLIDLSSL